MKGLFAGIVSALVVLIIGLVLEWLAVPAYIAVIIALVLLAVCALGKKFGPSLWRRLKGFIGLLGQKLNPTPYVRKMLGMNELNDNVETLFELVSEEITKLADRIAKLEEMGSSTDSSSGKDDE